MHPIRHPYFIAHPSSGNGQTGHDSQAFTDRLQRSTLDGKANTTAFTSNWSTAKTKPQHNAHVRVQPRLCSTIRKGGLQRNPVLLCRLCVLCASPTPARTNAIGLRAPTIRKFVQFRVCGTPRPRPMASTRQCLAVYLCVPPPPRQAGFFRSRQNALPPTKPKSMSYRFTLQRLNAGKVVYLCDVRREGRIVLQLVSLLHGWRYCTVVCCETSVRRLELASWKLVTTEPVLWGSVHRALDYARCPDQCGS